MMLHQLLAANKLSVFLLISSATMLIMFFQQELVAKFELDNMMEAATMNKSFAVAFLNNIKWLILILIPLMLLIRISYTSTCLYIGAIIMEKDTKEFNYRGMFNIALKGDAILLVGVLYNFIRYSYMPASSPFDLYKYTSLLGLVNSTKAWIIAGLMLINIFEIFYMLFLSKLISAQYNMSYKQSLKFVLTTYGIGLLAYVMSLMIILLNIGI